jgi:tripartite-type tricarboxylate transporter receptor subunit TctC
MPRRISTRLDRKGSAHPAVATLLLSLAASAMCAPTASAADFYDGKRITFIVGGTAGAGLDTYARTVARHLPRYLPGNPGTIVQNMPGAGSQQAAEYMQTQAPKDGTAIGSVFPGAVMAPLLETRKPRFDPVKFNYLGTAEAGARICATFHTSKVKTYEDARKTKTIVAASQSGGSSRDYTLMANALAKTQFQMVSGYKGGSDMFLAVERGEVEGLCGFDWSTIKAARGQWLKDNKINIIIQFGLKPDPELTKRKVPEFFKHVPAADRPVAELVVAQQVFSRMFFVPAEVPADRVELLRDAFAKTMKDSQFLAEATKARLNIDPMDGTEVQKVVRQIFKSPPDIVARARKALTPTN